MKSLILIILIGLPLMSWAQDKDCDEVIPNSDILDTAEKLQVPNCSQSKFIMQANEGDFSSLCQTCRPELEKSLAIYGIDNLSKKKLPLTDFVLDEFKKSLASNLLDIAKLRTLPSTNADFSSAIKECSIDKLAEDLKASNCLDGSSMDELRNQLNEELAHILNPNTQFNNLGLYDRSRSNQPSCKISDADIINSMSLTLEAELDAEMVEKLSSFNPNASIESSLASTFPDTGLNTLFLNHPIMAALKGNSTDFIAFFKNLQRPVTKENVKNALYDDSKTHLSTSIANKCKSSFSAYKKAACSKDVKNGNSNFKSLADARPLVGPIDGSRKKYVDPTDITSLEMSMNAAKVCMTSPETKSFDLSSVLETLQHGQSESYASEPYKTVRKNKYHQEIGKARDGLCSLQEPCDKTNVLCKINDNLLKIKNSTTTESRLANSGDKSINSLLRSMIGTASNLSSSSKVVLISKGIIPDDSGKIVEQPIIPERSKGLNTKSEVTTSPQNAQVSQSSQPQSQASSYNRANVSRNTFAPVPVPSQSSVQSSSAETTNLDSLSRSISDSREQLAKINENILNRLSKPNAPQAVSREDFRQMTREAYKEQNRPLPAAEEDQFVNNYFPQQQLGQATQFTQGRQAQFEKPTSPEQLKRNLREKQRNEALAKFAAVRDGQSSGAADEAAPQRGPASEKTGSSSSADIAINLPEGSTRLSEVITPQLPDIKKMMAKGEDFTFKIHQSSNDSVFKIIKHGPNKFDVVFLSGDEKKASLYRTELQNILDNLAVRASREALRNALTTP